MPIHIHDRLDLVIGAVVSILGLLNPWLSKWDKRQPRHSIALLTVGYVCFGLALTIPGLDFHPGIFGAAMHFVFIVLLLVFLICSYIARKKAQASADK